MFGYVVVNKPELKIREYKEYHSCYCGLCRALQNAGGNKAQLSLSYDMTFLALLLSALYEPEEERVLYRCLVHPMEKQPVRQNEMIDYAADMTLLLTWYKCRDDYLDEKKYGRALYGRILEGTIKKISSRYKRQKQIVEEYMDKLSSLEQQSCSDIDALSGCFGTLLAEIFAFRQDEWVTSLRKIGFYLGKFVYILDAYDDLEKDKKKGCFNPFVEREINPDFDLWVKELLQMAVVEAAREFEKLPILENVEILRNILYSGIWTRYEEVRSKRQKDKKESLDDMVKQVGRMEAENEKSL